MQANNPARKAVKVSYQGETKRLKLSGAYQELIDRTRSAFKNLPQSIKYFYLDEDNEIISISSQSDYTEALEIEDFSALRLTVATSASDARQQLLVQLEEQRPLAESLNSSVIMSQHNGAAGFGRGSTMVNNFLEESEFDAISHQELGQSSLKRSVTMMDNQSNAGHEIAIGSDEPLKESFSIGTQAMATAVKAEAGCNTARVTTSEKMIDTCVSTNEMSSQAHTNVRDQGCDGIRAAMHNQAVQMEVQVKDCDVTCDLLIPSDNEGDENLEEVACIKCEGSQMNKKGLPCRKCNGRGTLVSKELSAVAAMVRQEVQEYCYASFKQMFTDHIHKKRDDQNEVVHENVVCDGCQATPMKGIRYMCSVCGDTDFCQKCEREGVHSQHPLLKVRKPDQAPAKLICQYKNGDSTQQSSMAAMMGAAAGGNQVWERSCSQAKKEVRYSARFVKESFPDKHEIITGDIFAKSWFMRNDGETAWPVGTQFLQTSGDDIQAQVSTLRQAVPAGDTYEFSIQCRAPSNEGRYTAFFRLQTGRIKFGHKVSCDILCVKPEEKPVESALIATQPVAMVSQSIAADKEVEMEAEAIYRDSFEPSNSDQIMSQPSSLLQSTISIDAKSPKQLYFEQVELLGSDESMKAALTSLYDFGFTNFGVNRTLMQKHNDVNVVAETLMTGALSESQFGAIYQGGQEQ